MEDNIRKKRHKHQHPEELNIIPLIDITANLLFFLMVGLDIKEKQEAGKNIELPGSSSKQNEEVQTVRLLISRDELTYDDTKGAQHLMAQLRKGKLAADQLNKEGRISKLQGELEKRRKEIERQGLDMTVEKNKPVVLLLADKTLDYETVLAVMHTAGSAGFPRFRFGVLMR